MRFYCVLDFFILLFNSFTIFFFPPQGKEVLLYYINELLAEGINGLPTWQEIHGGGAEEEKGVDTHLPCIKENEIVSTPKKKKSTLEKQRSVRESVAPYYFANRDF